MLQIKSTLNPRSFHRVRHNNHDDKGKSKVVPLLYVTEHHVMKAYWGQDV